jgi:hypothetical protein
VLEREFLFKKNYPPMLKGKEIIKGLPCVNERKLLVLLKVEYLKICCAIAKGGLECICPQPC